MSVKLEENVGDSPVAIVRHSARANKFRTKLEFDCTSLGRTLVSADVIGVAGCRRLNLFAVASMQ